MEIYRNISLINGIFPRHKCVYILLTLVESACCPLSMGLTKRFRNSFNVPSKSGFTKDAIQWYSIKLFCNGVPVSTHRRRVLIVASTLAIADSEFLSKWPSSQTIISGPGSTRAIFCIFLYLPTRVRVPDARILYLQKMVSYVIIRTKSKSYMS